MQISLPYRFHAVIATHCRAQLVRRTLQSLVSAALPESLVGIHVIENGSDDGTRAVCNQIDSAVPIVYHHYQQPGKSRALDRWMDANDCDFVLFLDDDILVDKGFFQAYDRSIQRYGKGHFFGGPVFPDYEEEPAEWLIEYLPRSVRGWSCDAPSRLGTGNHFFLGANYGAFAEDIDKAGGFSDYMGPGSMLLNPSASPTGQEYDMQMRLVKHGQTPVYIEDAIVYHFVPRERCSVEWALDRVFRQSMGSEIMRIKSENASNGALLRREIILRKRLLRLVPAKILSKSGGGPKEDFKLKWRTQFIKGKLKGIEVTRKIDI